MANILVIDDDESVLNMLGMMLRRGGHTAALAGSAASGLELAASEAFDLIITDVMMPEMDGYELTRRLRAAERTKDARILVLTARAQRVDHDSAMEAGADGYLAKPIAHDVLNKRVDELLAAPRVPLRSGLKGHLVCVLGLRGGVGTTTIAVNLALGLLRARIRTCLIDLSPAGGHVALQLRLRPKSSWDDLPAGSGQIDFESHLLRHPSGLQVLAAPTRPVRHGFPLEQFERALASLSELFSVLVVDCAPWLDDATYAALGRAHVVVLVSTPDVGSVQTLTTTLPVLHEAGIAPDRLRFVLNNVSPVTGLPVAAVEKALGRVVDVAVPFEDAQAQAVLQGQPLMVSNPKGALPTHVGRLLASL